MPKSVPIFFLIVCVVVLIFVGNKMISKQFSLGGPEDNSTNSDSSVSTSTPVPTPTPYAGSYPETSIISGPSDGDIIKDEAVAVFHFSGIWDGDQSDISFETKISEIDSDWRSTSVTSRSVELLSGDHTYTFQVRAKTKSGIYDQTPAQRTFRAVISSEMGKVKIISISPGKYPSQIMKITVRNDAENSVDVTGWTLESTSGKISIPQAIGLYDPSLLNQSQLSDIILNKGDYLYIFGQASPMDLNFKLNKCFGYLNATYDFNPDLPNQCPFPDKSEMSGTTLACQNYLSGLSSCQAPSSQELNNLGDSACSSFSDSRLNYRGCINRYKYDPDFYKDEWYVYVGTNFVKEKNERVVLRDAAGLLVDYMEY